MNSWIIKEKLDLTSIRPVVDNLTNTLTELDLLKNQRSTQGPASQQWELIGCTEKSWLDLMQEMKEKIKVDMEQHLRENVKDRLKKGIRDMFDPKTNLDRIKKRTLE